MTCYLKGHTAKDFINEDHALADVLAEQELEVEEAGEPVEDSYFAMNLFHSAEVDDLNEGRNK